MRRSLLARETLVVSFLRFTLIVPTMIFEHTLLSPLRTIPSTHRAPPPPVSLGSHRCNQRSNSILVLCDFETTRHRSYFCGKKCGGLGVTNILCYLIRYIPSFISVRLQPIYFSLVHKLVSEPFKRRIGTPRSPLPLRHRPRTLRFD